MFFYSRDRTAVHPNRHLAGYVGVLQADAYAGFNELYRRSASRVRSPKRVAGRMAVVSSSNWLSWRKAPLALEAVRRIDAIFDVERGINGLPAEQRLAIRQRACRRPWSPSSRTWMRAARGKLSRHADVAKAMDYMLKRWKTFSRFLDDGRICLSNNAAERALRGIALGRKSWLFAGSDRGGERPRPRCTRSSSPPSSTTSIPAPGSPTCSAGSADHPASRLHELLPWNWAREAERHRLAA